MSWGDRKSGVVGAISRTFGSVSELPGHVPDAVVAEAQRLWGIVEENKRLCGDTASVEGWSIETHTLGCRYEAGTPEEDWLEEHWEIYSDYSSDGMSLVVGSPDDGDPFVTLTPEVKS